MLSSKGCIENRQGKDILSTEVTVDEGENQRAALEGNEKHCTCTHKHLSSVTPSCRHLMTSLDASGPHFLNIPGDEYHTHWYTKQLCLL